MQLHDHIQPISYQIHYVRICFHPVSLFWKLQIMYLLCLCYQGAKWEDSCR
jgi:hypothetical protein